MHKAALLFQHIRRCGKSQGASAALGFALAPALLVATTTPVPATESVLHTFTDNQGHILKAELLNVLGVTVTLKREDGQKAEIPLAAFSQSDQTYIVETILKQHSAHNETVFEISAIPQKADQASTKITGGTQVNWRESYRLTLKNQTSMTLGGMRACIIVFKALLLPDVPGVKQTPIVLLGQTFNLSQATAHAETVVQAEPYDMQQILANNGGYFPGAPAVHAETDKFLAIWVRVYDSNDYLVQEWCSSPAMTKQQDWNAAWVQATGPNYGTTPTPGTRSAQRGAGPGLPSPYNAAPESRRGS